MTMTLPAKLPHKFSRTIEPASPRAAGLYKNAATTEFSRMLGLVIASQRVYFGVSQGELSRYVGLAQNTIYRLERGYHINMHQLLVISAAFGKQPWELLMLADGKMKEQSNGS